MSEPEVEALSERDNLARFGVVGYRALGEDTDVPPGYCD